MSETAARPGAPARRPTLWERRPDRASRVVAIGVPVVLVLSSFGVGHTAWLGFAENPITGFSYSLLAMAALALIIFGNLYGCGGWWFAACPLCGHEAARDHFEGQPAPCGRCMAYLRYEEGRVVEESDDAVEFRPTYVVHPADLGPRELRFPPQCVLCGQSEELRRPIRTLRFGPLPAGPRRSITRDEQGWGPTAPVCARHVDDPREPLEVFQGELTFRSYAQYKAFCRHNGIERRRE